jgi:Flp pilus assembly protein TadB
LNERGTAEAIRALAALIRSGEPEREAVAKWHLDAPPALHSALRAAARRVTLGDTPERAIAGLDGTLGRDAGSLAAMFSLSSAIGGDLPAMLERLATTIEAREAAVQAGRAAAVGAVLSARVVAGLPLLLLALSPIAGAPLFDPAGIAMLAAGTGFAVAGLVWMSRLVPGPPSHDDIATTTADLASSALVGGASFHRVLDAVTQIAGGPGADELERVRRRVVLGISWYEALERSSDEGLCALGRVAKRALALGEPASHALEAFASSRRAAVLRDFEAATRRAPLVMAAPLSLCILPAYALLGLGPYVRSLSFSG